MEPINLNQEPIPLFFGCLLNIGIICVFCGGPIALFVGLYALLARYVPGKQSA